MISSKKLQIKSILSLIILISSFLGFPQTSNITNPLTDSNFAINNPEMAASQDFLNNTEQVTNNNFKEWETRFEMAKDTPFIVFERWLENEEDSTLNVWASMWNGTTWLESQLSFDGWANYFDLAISPGGIPHVVFITGDPEFYIEGDTGDSFPYHTYWNGSNWVNPTLIPGPWGTPPGNKHANPKSPNIEFDSIGNLHLVLELDDNMNTIDFPGDTDGLHDIYYTNRSYQGIWNIPIMISKTGSPDYQGPAIAIDSEDTVHVIFSTDLTSNDELYYLTKPSEGIFSSETIISTFMECIHRDLYLLIDDNDLLNVVLREIPSNNIYCQRKNINNWETPEFVGNSVAYDADFDSEDKLYISAFNSSTQILQGYYYYNDTWQTTNLTSSKDGSFLFPQHNYIGSSDVWVFIGKISEFDDYEVFYKPITELTPPINFNYQVFPDENGFILGNDTNNRYFLVDLKGNTEYFLSLVHNISYNEEGEEIGGAGVYLYDPIQIDDPNHDGIAEGVVNHDWHLLNTTHAEGDGYDRFFSFYVEDSKTYALYVECEPNIPIGCYLYIQESPGCMLLNADFCLNESYIESIGVDYVFSEKHFVYHVPGFKFIWKYIEEYLQDPELNPLFSLGGTRKQAQFLEYFNITDFRVNGYLRLDLPTITNYNESGNGKFWCPPYIFGVYSLKDLMFKRENDGKTINFTYIYEWYESTENRINMTTQHTFHLNYKAPGHVTIKQDQILNFKELYITDEGVPLNKCVIYIRFLPYYWQQVGDEFMNLSPTAGNSSGWYSIGDFQFSEIVYNPYYKEYLSNGSVNTKSIYSSVSSKYDEGRDMNYTLWYVDFFPHPINQNLPNGNLTKIVYDPVTNYYFDIPSWMIQDDDDDDDKQPEKPGSTTSATESEGTEPEETEPEETESRGIEPKSTPFLTFLVLTILFSLGVRKRKHKE